MGERSQVDAWVEQRDAVRAAVQQFVAWLDAYGETSYDHQSFFAGPVGGAAKSLYYKRPALGIAAVAPMIFLEAFLPSGRKLFWRRQRLPIADAHYAMGFALLAQLTGRDAYYARAVHFLEVLEETRCAGFTHYCWGYPFDWVTRSGLVRMGTPLITTTPYVYEAFGYVHQIDGNPRWLDIMESIADHAAIDIKDVATGENASSAGYDPTDVRAGVVNASAYRACLLIDAARRFARDDYMRIAMRNLNFVLGAQRTDGSWLYAVDSAGDFVDHFHTCFVMKALAKIERMIDHDGCRAALAAGADYYVRNLFDASGLPKPFSRAPRLTVYRRELYDYAECINLGVLLRRRFASLDACVDATLKDLLARWCKRDGSFRSRELLMGWDNVPMHRWAQSQMFRSLCLILTSGRESTGRATGHSEPASAIA